MASKGVYFIANDEAYDLVVAFLNSFRLNNPMLGLCLIPFGEPGGQPSTRVTALARKYNFLVWEDAALLARCDALSRVFHPEAPYHVGHYRKLAAWHGPFEEFIYIDCDTVITSNLSFAFDYLDEYAFVFSHSNLPQVRPTVWRDSVQDSGLLKPAQIEFAANTGFVASRWGVLGVDAAERGLAAALALRPHMALECMEQPFLNHLVVTSGHRYTSLRSLSLQRGLGCMPTERWGGIDLALPSHTHCSTQGANILFIHWAGCWRSTPFECRLWRWLQRLGLPVAVPAVSRFMKNGRTWRYYRHLPPAQLGERFVAAGPASPVEQPLGRVQAA